jgi:hypothetical protein
MLLMADYVADPLWLRSPTGRGWASVPLDRLPLSPDLKAQLRSWAGRYDGLMKTGYEWPDAETRTAWVHDGRDLLVLLRAELGAVYEVSYSEAGA